MIVASPKGIFSMSDETRLIMTRLEETTPGDIVRWEELEELTSCVRSRVYPLTRTATRCLERDLRYHYRTIAGVGVERIDHCTSAREEVPKKRKAICRAANAVITKTEHIILDEVPVADRPTLIAQQTTAILAREANSDRGIKKLAATHERERTLAPFSPMEAYKRMLAGE